MLDDNETPSPINALIALTPLDHGWQPILHISDQVVLYNPTSHALSIRTHTRPQTPGLTHRTGRRCPYCHRFLPDDMESELEVDDELDHEFDEDIQQARNRVANYFQLLEIANGTASRPITPTSSSSSRTSSQSSTGARPSAFRAENLAEGYFKAFFKEECKLGMGANGSVFLCQHVLDGNSLGYFAVKKIAVGQSHSYLIQILREVRLLEKLHHPNIITYHHAWLETCQFSSFGPKVPTLHVLMQWAEGGSLDDFIEARLGRQGPVHLPHLNAAARATSVGADSASPSPQPDSEASPTPPYSRTARIRAFRAMQRASPAEKERLRRELGLSENGRGPANWKAVHLLSAEEVKGLFGDVVAGIAFLHEKSILHLDLKPGNVLLTWDEGKLIPRAMLSDFGTSQDMLQSRARSGNTGTLEYAAPESLPAPTGLLRQVDSKADMWSVGMLLHKLLFFKLPYRYASDSSAAGSLNDTADALEKEVASYAGYWYRFKSSPTQAAAFESRRLPRAYLVLLESLLNTAPSARPSSERVLAALREGRLDPLNVDPLTRSNSRASLVPVTRRRKINGSVKTSIVETEFVEASCMKCADGSLATEEAGQVLGLLAPSSPSSYSRMDSPSGWCGRTLRDIMPSAVWVRTLKSLILILKVRTLSTMCPETRPHPLVVSLVLALAVVDTWFDKLPVTLVLGVVHIALMYLACYSGSPCIQA
ncbi:kinase-like protein [Obba rivulosa]|uniref:non-specific serine/threonine protein kinase n=1 Tax=Obba rivulosa TaxID=1052685 RepID=A0A8E2DPE7_9APHY|nr:kinase-like protein [Obba rivulosa]